VNRPDMCNSGKTYRLRQSPQYASAPPPAQADNDNAKHKASHRQRSLATLMATQVMSRECLIYRKSKTELSSF
jgi:hypothetical protein